MNNFFLVASFLLCSNFCFGGILKNLSLEDAEVFIEKGSPYASSYYHDSKNFQLDSREGFPGVYAGIEISGVYRYMIDGEWVQESINKVVVEWGDGVSEEAEPSVWPLYLKHKYGYDEDNFKVTISEPTEFDFKLTFFSDIGSEFVQYGSYRVSLDQNGMGAYSKPTALVKHYWYDSDCQMVNGLCYKGDTVVYENEMMNISVDLTLSDYFEASGVSYFGDINYVLKDIVCSNGYVQNGGECFKLVDSGTETSSYEALSYTVNNKGNLYDDYYLHEIQVGEIISFDLFAYMGPYGSGCTNTWGSVSGVYDASKGFYVVTARCVVNVEVRGCRDISEELYLSNDNYYCRTSVVVQEEVHDEFFENCYNVVNPSVSLNNGRLVVGGTDFSCYDSITVLNVCYEPYQVEGGVCSYSENILELEEGVTNDNNPKDTYKREGE